MSVCERVRLVVMCLMRSHCKIEYLLRTNSHKRSEIPIQFSKPFFIFLICGYLPVFSPGVDKDA